MTEVGSLPRFLSGSAIPYMHAVIVVFDMSKPANLARYALLFSSLPFSRRAMKSLCSGFCVSSAIPYVINQHVVMVELSICKPADLAQNALSQLSLIIEAYHGVLLLRFSIPRLTPHLVIQHTVFVNLGI